ncbi:DVUA0089 family protein [Paludibaculum fermentans]|uniref:DVUA0089 family protein n=1 Tax=Paludibaculum fermentans TaxID=1473598 RepID=UPI003EBC35DA
MPHSWGVLLFSVLGAFSASAGTISIVGSLAAGDPNDVFIYAVTVAPGGNLTIQGWGYGGGVNAAGAVIPPGGLDGYLSVFSGSGPTATFLASDDDGGCPPGAAAPFCADPRLVLTGLAPGAYTLALSTFGNMSFAENWGAGTLGDGFVGLGSYFDWRTLSDRTPAYALDITTDNGAPVPEPGSASLLALAILAAAFRAAHKSM